MNCQEMDSIEYSKGHFSRSEKGQIWLFCQFSQKWCDNISLFVLYMLCIHTASWGRY